jgi:hypothetical protein
MTQSANRKTILKTRPSRRRARGATPRRSRFCAIRLTTSYLNWRSPVFAEACPASTLAQALVFPILLGIKGNEEGWLPDEALALAGKDRWHGLGPLHTISLAQAREKAADARRVRLDGHDPIEVKRASRAAARLDAAKAISFDAAATAYIKSHSDGWKNTKHAAQWTATLTTYASLYSARYRCR